MNRARRRVHNHQNYEKRNIKIVITDINKLYRQNGFGILEVTEIVPETVNAVIENVTIEDVEV